MKLAYFFLFSTTFFTLPVTSFAAVHQLNEPEETQAAVRSLNKGRDLKWSVQSNGVCLDENNSTVGHLIGPSLILTEIQHLCTDGKVYPESLSLQGDAGGFGVRIHYSKKSFPYALVALNSPLNATIKASKLFNKDKDKQKNETDIGLSFIELLKIRKWAALEKDQGSLSYLTNLANQQNPQAQYIFGSIDYKEGKYKEAYELFLKAGKQGFGKAESMLGVMFKNGHYVKQNEELGNKYYSEAEKHGSQKHHKFRDKVDTLKPLEDQADKSAKAGTQVPNKSEEKQGQTKLANSMSLEIKKHQKATEQDNVKAHYQLGVCYFAGNGVDQDYKLASEWFEKAANEGHAKAQYNLGMCYDFGWGVDQDDGQAFKWYMKAAQNGDAEAQFIVGRCYADGKGVDQDYKLASEWFEKAAQNGDVYSQYNLGMCYMNGMGVKKNDRQAFEWYQKAANKGHAKAQYNLGAFYKNGMGVEKNDRLAFEWFQKAADQRNAEAQYNLGWCYAKGQGVDQNCELAFEWYQKAATQGHAEAQYNLGVCYKNGMGVENNDRLAFEWIKKAAQNGDAFAQYKLGICYKNGMGVDQDYGQAFKCFQKAAKQDIPEAAYSLGFYYAAGKGVTVDMGLAVKCFFEASKNGHAEALAQLRKLASEGVVEAQERLSELDSKHESPKEDVQDPLRSLMEDSNNGNARAQKTLGYKYLHGEGLEQNDIKAFELFQAASQTSANAKCLLAWMYEMGRGTTKDEAKAADLYFEAACDGDTESLKRLEKLAVKNVYAQELFSRLNFSDIPALEPGD